MGKVLRPRTPTQLEINANPGLADPAYPGSPLIGKVTDDTLDALLQAQDVQDQDVYEATRPPVIRHRNPIVNELIARVEALEARIQEGEIA